MFKTFLIHGTGGNSHENWFPWLRAELEKMSIEVISPDFPIGREQSLANWQHTFEPYMEMLDGKTLLVGHSIGPAFILSVLEKVRTKVHAAFLVAPFTDKLGLPDFDPLNASFAEKDFDWERIRKNCGSFYVYASDNDPYASIDKSRYVADRLNATFKVVHGAGHFNAAAGYLKFEELLEDIKALNLLKNHKGPE